MNRLTFLLAFGALQICAWAQSPHLSLQFDAGAARPWVRNENPYAVIDKSWQAQAGAGCGLTWGMGKHFQFSPEAGIEYYGLRHQYIAGFGGQHIVSTLSLFYGRVSPGITLKAASVFSLRAGVNFLGSAAAIGKYSVWYVDQDLNQVMTNTYADHFGRIRNPFLFGPELSLGLDFPLPDDGGSFGFRVTCFLSANHVFRSDFNTPFNPLLSRLNLGLRYVLPD